MIYFQSKHLYYIFSFCPHSYQGSRLQGKNLILWEIFSFKSSTFFFYELGQVLFFSSRILWHAIPSYREANTNLPKLPAPFENERENIEASEQSPLFTGISMPNIKA